jgi:hypothetical protein
MTDRDRLVHNLLNQYLRVLVNGRFDIEVYSVGPLDKGSVAFTLRAFGPAEVRISGKVGWAALDQGGEPVPEMFVLIQVGPEFRVPALTVEPYCSLVRDQFQVSSDNFVYELQSKLAELEKK